MKRDQEGSKEIQDKVKRCHLMKINLVLFGFVLWMFSLISKKKKKEAHITNRHSRGTKSIKGEKSGRERRSRREVQSAAEASMAQRIQSWRITGLERHFSKADTILSFWRGGGRLVLQFMHLWLSLSLCAACVGSEAGLWVRRATSSQNDVYTSSDLSLNMSGVSLAKSASGSRGLGVKARTGNHVQEWAGLVRSQALNQPRRARGEAHTFSFDWISRDFLRARTCKWLETCTEE